MAVSFSSSTTPLPGRNPYISWGEELAGQFDVQREFRGIPDKSILDDSANIRDLRQVYVRCIEPDMSEKDAFKEVATLTGVPVSATEQALVTKVAERPRHLEFIAAVPAHWALTSSDPSEENEQTFLKLFRPIAVGPRLFDVGKLADAEAEGKRDRAHGSNETKVVAGVIDDGIAYLNQRFFNAKTPRIKGLMLQTSAYFRCNENGTMSKDILTFQEINDAEIKRRRGEANKFGEREIYVRERRNDPLLSPGVPVGVPKTAEHAVSHGTFILDLMAGSPSHQKTTPNDRENALRAIPILAAQLPPQSVDDTSGARLEVPIILAMRWMMARALDMGAEHLVINLAFGVSAGPKDGNSHLEQIFERLVDQAGKIGLKLHIVLPFGNEYLARGVQVSKLEKNSADEQPSVSAELVLARADQTPSFVEVHVKDEKALPDNLEISIAAPGDGQTQFISLTKNSFVNIISHDEVVGRLSHIETRDHFSGGDQNLESARLHLALSPTAEPRRNPPPDKQEVPFGLATQGRWHIHVRRKAVDGEPVNDKPIEIVVQVQRDDSAFGYHYRGQQTVLDQKDSHEWSPHFRDMTEFSSQTPLVRVGTNTAYVSRARSNGPQGGVYVVASARDYYRKEDKKPKAGLGRLPQPSDYASQRAPWSAAKPPDQSVILTDKPAGLGVLGAGNASGSAVQLLGSSVATALFSRELLFKYSGVNGVNLPERLPPAEDQDRTGAIAKPLPPEIREKRRAWA